MNIDKAIEEYDQDPDAFELKYGPEAVKEVLKASVHFVPFPTDDKEPKVPSFKEDKWFDTAVWAAKEPFEEAKERFLGAGQGATLEIPKTDNALVRSYMQSLDYAASMGLAGLEASDAAFKFAVGAASELIPNGSKQVERRFTRDVGSIPDAFLGASPSNVKRATDQVADSFEDTVKNIMDSQDTSKVGIFAGVGSKTAPTGSLPPLEEVGVAPEKMWLDYGWFRGPDDRFRYEIDDNASTFVTEGDILMDPEDLPNVKALLGSAAKEEALGLRAPYQYREGQDKLTTVGDLLKHPKLEEAYPDLFKIPVVLKEDLEGAAWISPNYNAGHDETIWLGATFDKNTPKEMLLHELQHAVQYRENFFGGSSPADVFDKVYRDTYENQKFEISKDFALSFEEKQEKLRELNKNYNVAVLEDYETTFGEEEARAVMDRLQLTEGEKEKFFPYYSHLLSRKRADVAQTQKTPDTYEVIDKLWLQGATKYDY